jgi:hypothetical protein
MLFLDNTILLVSMGAGNLVSNAKLTKVGVEMHGDNILIEPSFNKGAKFQENFEDIWFMMQQVDPSEFTIIVNEGHIIFLTEGKND